MAFLYREITTDDLPGCGSGCASCPRITDKYGRRKQGLSVRALLDEGEPVALTAFRLPGFIGKALNADEPAVLICIRSFIERPGGDAVRHLLHRLEAELLEAGCTSLEAKCRPADACLSSELLLENGFRERKKVVDAVVLRLDLKTLVRGFEVQKRFSAFPVLSRPAVERLLAGKVRA